MSGLRPRNRYQDVIYLPQNGEKSQLSDFVAGVEKQLGKTFPSPHDFHAFSVERFHDFWGLFLDWADPLRSGDPEPVCTDDRCEAATFFPNLRLNYAENLLEPRAPEQDERIAVVARHGDGSRQEIS
ncbi:MAG: hypothetical protein ACTHNP_13785, partial [Solirubrobacterales bacterium]